MTRGRPSAWRPEFAEQAYKYCLLGATDIQMAEFFGVSNQTFNAWKKKQPDLLDALKRGKAVADANVAHGLYKRATGYEITEEVIKTVAGKIERVETTKHFPPDTAAAFIWLKNRVPTQFKDKQQIEHSGRIDYANLTDDEIERKIAELSKE